MFESPFSTLLQRISDLIGIGTLAPIVPPTIAFVLSVIAAVIGYYFDGLPLAIPLFFFTVSFAFHVYIQTLLCSATAMLVGGYYYYLVAEMKFVIKLADRVGYLCHERGLTDCECKKEVFAKNGLAFPETMRVEYCGQFDGVQVTN